MKMTRTRIVLLGLCAALVVLGVAFIAWQLRPHKRLARHVTKARLYVKTQQYAQALNAYEQALDIAPQHDTVLSELGYLRLGLDQPDRAEKHFENCLEAHPAHRDACIGLVRARLAQKKFDDALQAAENLLALDGSASARVVYGDALAAAQRYEEALQTYRQAVATSPTQFEPLQHLVRLLFLVQRHYEARQLLENYAARPEAGERQEALAALAQIALRENRPRAALQLFDAALQVRSTPELLVWRAHVQLTLRRFQAALADLGAAGATGENAPLARKVRAACLLEQGELKEALAQALTAERLLPQDAELQLLLARIHYQRGYALEAEEKARRATLLRPHYFAAQNLVLSLLLERALYEQAISFGRELLSRPPCNELALRKLAQAYLAVQRQDEARRVFATLRTGAAAVLSDATPVTEPGLPLQWLTALKAHEQASATMQYLAAQTHLQLHNLPEALTCLERAAALEPQRFETQLALAALYRSLGQHDEAASRLEKIAAGHPLALAPVLWLAQMRLQQRRYDAAAQLYAKLLREADAPAEAAVGLINARLAQQDANGLTAAIDVLRQHPTPYREALARVVLAAQRGKQGDPRGALELLEQACALAPGLALPAQERALFLMHADRWGEAAEALARVDGEDGQSAHGLRLDYAAALLLAGKTADARQVALQEHLLFSNPQTLLLCVAAALKAADPSAAEKLLDDMGQQRLELQPIAEVLKLPSATELFDRLVLAETYSRNGMLAWTLETLQQARKLAPESRDLAALHAAALLRVGHNKEGGEILLELTKASPKRADFLLMLGDLRFSEGKWDEATALYSRVASLWPEHLRVLRVLGALLRSRGQSQAAAELLYKAIKLAPQDSAALAQYVWLLAVDLNAPQRALPYAQDLWRAAPHNPAALETAGWTFSLNARHDEARKALSYAARLAPGSAQIAYHHGLALLKSQLREEALQELRRARALEGSTPALGQAVEQAIAEIEGGLGALK